MTKNFTFWHDDGCTIYLNGAVAYQSAGYKSSNNGQTGNVTLNLSAGWNIIEILIVQHYSPDGVWNIIPTIGSLVTTLNCYYSKDAGLGTVNKFADADLWAFPSLKQGASTIGISIVTADVSIAYKPKFL